MQVFHFGYIDSNFSCHIHYLYIKVKFYSHNFRLENLYYELTHLHGQLIKLNFHQAYPFHNIYKRLNNIY